MKDLPIDIDIDIDIDMVIVVRSLKALILYDC